MLYFSFLISLLSLLSSRYLIKILLEIRIALRYCFLYVLRDIYYILGRVSAFLLLLFRHIIFWSEILHFDYLNLELLAALLSIMHFINCLVLLFLANLLFLVTKTRRKSLYFYYVRFFFVFFLILFSFVALSLMFNCIFSVAFIMWTLIRIRFQVRQINLLYFDYLRRRTSRSLILLLLFCPIILHFIIFWWQISTFNIWLLYIR